MLGENILIKIGISYNRIGKLEADIFVFSFIQVNLENNLGF